MSLKAIGLALVVAVSSASVVQAQDTTLVDGDTGPGLVPVTTDATTFAGQTFTAPAARAYIDRFRFWALQFIGTPATVDLSLWSFSGGTLGTNLWNQTLVAPQVGVGMVEAIIPNISVVPNQMYAMMMTGTSILGLGTTIEILTLEGYSTGTYGGGQLIGALGPLANGTTVQLNHPSDLRFEARFGGQQQVVPEPATVFLLATGVLGIGGVTLARRRKQIGLTDRLNEEESRTARRRNPCTNPSRIDFLHPATNGEIECV